jgi:hypothetical protein
MCCLYICSENKASLVPVGTVAVAISTEVVITVVLLTTETGQSNAKCEWVRPSFLVADLRVQMLACHDSVCRTRLLCGRLTLVYFYNPIYFLFVW